MEDELINTLVLPIEPKAARPPRLDRNGSVWAAAAKLGRYLTSGMTQEEREGLALPLLRVISRTAGEECEPPAASVASAFARRTKSRAHFLRAGEAWYVASMSAFPASHCGTHVWLWSHERNGRRGEAVTAFDIPTAVGALAVTDESDVVDRVLSRNKYVAAPIRERFFSLAAERWTVEENLAANRRYASAHSAGVFEDKLSCDEAHRGAAASSLFARRFAHVEIDDSVDLGQFVRLDREAAELADRGWLPAIGSDNSIRFRLCGRHRAIGVYSPSLKAIAIDPARAALRRPRDGPRLRLRARAAVGEAGVPLHPRQAARGAVRHGPHGLAADLLVDPDRGVRPRLRVAPAVHRAGVVDDERGRGRAARGRPVGRAAVG